MVCLYLAFSSDHFRGGFSSKCKRLSATALVSGKLILLVQLDTSHQLNRLFSQETPKSAHLL